MTETTPEDAAELEQQACKDLQGVFNADVVVVLNTQKSEGKAVETGVALVQGIPIVVVGARTSIFHFLKDFIDIVPDVPTMLEGLKRYE